MLSFANPQKQEFHLQKQKWLIQKCLFLKICLLLQIVAMCYEKTSCSIHIMKKKSNLFKTMVE